MIATSDAYRQASRKHRTEYVRDSFDVVITLGNVDIATPQSITSETYDAGAESTLFTRETMGQMRTYVSGSAALPDGSFAATPFIDVTFGTAQNIPAVTLEFARDIGPAPGEFVIYGYQNTVLAYTLTTVNNNEYFVVKAGPMNGVTRVRVEFMAGTPGERIELYGLTFGDGFIFDGDDIVEFVHNRTGHPRGLEMYMSDMLISADNSHGRFPVDSDTALGAWFDGSRVARLYYRYPLDGGAYEQFLAATMYLNDATEEGSALKIDCSDIFDQMSKTEYLWGADSSAGIDVVIESVLDDYGVTDYDVSNTLQNVSPPMYTSSIPICSHLEALQYCAMFACGVFRVTPTGRIVFVAHEKQITDYYINTFDYPQAPFSRPESIRTKGKPEYATFEEDWFRADGTQILLPENSAECVDTGYALNLLPDVVTGEYGGNQINIDIMTARPFSRARIGISRFGSAIDRYGLYASSGAAPLIPTTVTATDRGREVAWNLDFTGVVWLFFTAKSATKQQRVRIVEVDIDDVSASDVSADDCVEPIGKTNAAKCSRVDVAYMPYLYTEGSLSGLWENDTVTVPYKSPVVIRYDAPAWSAMVVDITPTASDYDARFGGNAFGIEIKDGASATGPYNVVISRVPKVEPAEETRTVSVHGDGEPLSIASPIITTGTDAERVANWLASYYAQGFEYSLKYLGFPEIDVGDLISFDGNVVEVISHKITGSAGSFRGELVARGGA